MRFSPTFAWHVLAVCLLALAPAAGMTAQAQQPMIVAQASDDDVADGDDVARRRGMADDTDATDDASEIKPVERVSDSDPFYRSDEPDSVPQPGGKDVVVCMAGCDGPRGVVVYKKPKLVE